MRRPVRRFLRENGLSLVMFSLFVVFWGGQSVTGWLHHNDEQQQHGRPPQPWTAYVTSGAFIEATAENWESEFLQMAAFVLLSAFLVQKGSAESKDTREIARERKTDPHSERSPDSPWPVHRGGLALRVYNHSLSITLGVLFGVSFALHALGGWLAYNEEGATHGQPAVSMWRFVTGSTFWFQSLQNWQSEFLSVAVLTVLSIFLRERGSAQSKRVEAGHGETGP
jgi:hypothetical protein